MTTTDYITTNALRYFGLDRNSVDIRQYIQNVADDDIEFIDINATEHEYRAQLQNILPDDLIFDGANILGTREAFSRADRCAIIDAAQDIDPIDVFVDQEEDD